MGDSCEFRVFIDLSRHWVGSRAGAQVCYTIEPLLLRADLYARIAFARFVRVYARVRMGSRVLYARIALVRFVRAY